MRQKSSIKINIHYVKETLEYFLKSFYPNGASLSFQAGQSACVYQWFSSLQWLGLTKVMVLVPVDKCVLETWNQQLWLLSSHSLDKKVWPS